jgi:hypothetical protein
MVSATKSSLVPSLLALATLHSSKVQQIYAVDGQQIKALSVLLTALQKQWPPHGVSYLVQTVEHGVSRVLQIVGHV